MTKPFASVEPSDYAPRRVRGLASLGVRLDGSQPVPLSHSSAEHIGRSDARIANLKKTLAMIADPAVGRSLEPVAVAYPPRPSFTLRLRKVAAFVCVAIIGAAVGTALQLGYERLRKPEPSPSGQPTFLRSVQTITSAPLALSPRTPSELVRQAPPDAAPPVITAPSIAPVEQPLTKHPASEEVTGVSNEGTKTNYRSPTPEFRRSLPPAEAAFLFTMGQEFLRVGDIASARALFERAAEAGNGQAAFALAASYDPKVLRRFGLEAVSADAVLADVWYEKAAKLGVPAISDPVR